MTLYDDIENYDNNYFDDYFQTVQELADNYDFTQEEIIYQTEYFENCFLSGIKPSKALKKLSLDLL
jgi:hypothetical protein